MNCEKHISRLRLGVFVLVGLTAALSVSAQTYIVDVPAGTVQTNLTATQLTAISALTAADTFVKTGDGELYLKDANLNDISGFTGTIAVSNGIYSARTINSVGVIGTAQIVVSDGATFRIVGNSIDALDRNAAWSGLKVRVAGTGAPGTRGAFVGQHNYSGDYTHFVANRCHFALDGDATFGRGSGNGDYEKYLYFFAWREGSLDLGGHKLTLVDTCQFPAYTRDRPIDYSPIVSSGTLRFASSEAESLRLAPLPVTEEARTGTVEIAAGMTFNAAYCFPAPEAAPTFYHWTMKFEEAKTYASADYRRLWDVWYGEMVFPAGSSLTYETDDAVTHTASVSETGIVSFLKDAALHVGPGSNVSVSGGLVALKATNTANEPNAVATVTADAFNAVSKRSFVSVAAGLTLVLSGTTLNGTLSSLEGAGDFTFAAGEAKIAAAYAFTGHLRILGGRVTVPESLKGRVTAENGAVVIYATFDELMPAAVKLTTTGYTGTSTLANFPVLVRVSETALPGFRYADCRADGRDLVFFAPEALTEYPCEVEAWDPSGESLIWVKVPELTATTSFRLCWGEGRRQRIDAAEVWRRADGAGTRDFTAVWHMTEATGDVEDQTGHGLVAVPYKNNKTEGYASSVATDGAVGSGRHIADDADMGDMGSNGPKLRVDRDLYNAQNLGGVFTVSTWARPTAKSVSSYPRLFSCKESNEAADGWEIHAINDGVQFCQRASGQSVLRTTLPSDAWQAGKWTYFTFVYNGTHLTMYADGVLVGTKEVASAATAAATPFHLGGCYADRSLAGDMDETRLIGEAMTADWVAADYATQADAAFCAVGSVNEGLVFKTRAFSDEIRVTVGHTRDDGSRTLTVTVLDEQGATVSSQVFENAAKGEIRDLTFTGLSRHTAYSVVLSTPSLSSRTSNVRTGKCYSLNGTDQGTGCSSFDGTLRTDSWVNVEDATDKQTGASAGNEYVVSGSGIQLRSNSNAGGVKTPFVFPGARLVIRDSAEFVMKHYSETGLVTIPELVLQDASMYENITATCYLNTHLVIPAGHTGNISQIDDAYERSFTLYGSVSGGGTLAFPSDWGWGHHRITFCNDATAFSGKLDFAGLTYSYLNDGCRPVGEMATLTEDGIKFVGRHTMSVRGNVVSEARTRGVMIPADPDSPTIGFTVSLAVSNGCSLVVKNPLYGVGNVTTKQPTRTDADSLDKNPFFNGGTIEFAANAGEWTGTFSATNGTVILSGSKPLGEGTLDISGAARVELDAGALAGGVCYLKAATATTRVNVTLPDSFDAAAGLGLIATPADGGLTRDQIVFSGGLPEGSVLRASVADGVRTYTVGKKGGFVLIFR